MARDASGNYTLPQADVVTGTTIDVSWANPTLNDIKDELTDSLSRSGKGGMTAALKVANGTVGAPSYSWSNESNTGFYRSGTNDMRLAVNGADVVTYTAGQMSLVDGTVSVPAIGFANDVDTGMYASAVAEVAFACAGAQVLKLDATNVTTTLDVLTGDGAVGAPSYSFGTDTNTGFYSRAADQIGISSGGADIASVRSTGAYVENNIEFGGLEVDGVTTRRIGVVNTSDEVVLADTITGTVIGAQADAIGPKVSLSDGATRSRVASYELKNGWSKGEYTLQDTVTAVASTTIDADESNSFYINLTTNITTLTISNLDNGQSITLLVRQDATNDITWPAGLYWSNASDGPTITQTSGRYDLFTFTRMNSLTFVTYAQNFQT